MKLVVSWLINWLVGGWAGWLVDLGTVLQVKEETESIFPVT